MVGSPSNILSHTREEGGGGRWSLVYQGLSQQLITSLAGTKAADASLVSGQAICKPPSKARMPTRLYWGGERDSSASRELRWVGCSPFVMLPRNPITMAARDAGGWCSPCWLSPPWILLEYMVTIKISFVSPWWTGGWQLCYPICRFRPIWMRYLSFKCKKPSRQGFR